MLVVVEQIPDDLRRLRVDAGAAWVRAAAERAAEVPVTAASGELVLHREGRKVQVEGSLHVQASATCGRCGEDCALALSVPVALAFEPFQASIKPDDEEEVELHEPELDLGFYHDGKLDLADVVCEAVTLALPARVVCADVAACDARTAALLAERGASGSASHPGFAALKQRFS